MAKYYVQSGKTITTLAGIKKEGEEITAKMLSGGEDAFKKLIASKKCLITSTSKEADAKAKAEQEAKEKAEAKAKAESEAKEKAESEAKEKAESEVKEVAKDNGAQKK